MENGSRESSSGYSPLPTKRIDVQRNSSYKNMSAEIEQAVTRLLRTTKSLLEALNLWSQLRMSASDIFDLHRTLESQFYLVSQSFESAHVNTSDLTWIPHQLRQSVMECMEQEPSTVTLDRYLPRIRDAIVHLLHGLKGKQQELRDMDIQTPQMPSSPPQPQPGMPLSQRDSYRSQDYRTRSNENYTHNTTTTTSNLNYSDSTGSSRSARSYYSQQNYPPAPPTVSSIGSDRSSRSEYDPYTGGMPQPTTSSDSRHAYGQVSSPSTPNQPSYRKLSHVLSSASASPLPPVQQHPFPSRSTSTQQDKRTTATPNIPPVSAPAASSRYPQSTKNDSNKFDESDQHTANALAALKRQENLARRSSVRRASMYRGNNINNNNSNSDHNSKRHFADAPPVPSLGRVDENKATTLGTNLVVGPITASPSSSERTDNNNTNTESNVPTSSSQDTSASQPTYSSTSSTSPAPLTLYLQMDQQMKKVSYSGEITLPALSMLFIERFGYNAGQQDFPSIYIRDPSLPNVSYELQDLAEVTDKSVLSLTIHDQKEEKSMEWANSMVKEWNEAQRVMMEQMERLEQKVGQHDLDTEALVQQVVRQTLAIAPQPPTSEQQQEKTTDDVSEPTTTPADDTTLAPKSDGSTPATTIPPPPPPPPPSSTQVIQMHEDTKAQQQQQRDEIDKLQRQLMVLRQTQTEQQEEHAKVVADLEEQNLKLQKAMEDKSKETSDGTQQPSTTTTKSTLSQSRLYIEQGKEELLTSSDKITSRLEDLQDDIDHLKLDVTQRKCRPSEAQMDHCREERKALADDIDSFGTYISKVKPIWKKTWEQELQTIVKEQQTLKEQEGLLLDMNDDLAALQEVFENLEKICKFQEKSSSIRKQPVREFHVPPPDEGYQGMASVFKQVATIDVDHDRRLKALEVADRMRQRELANRTDEFEQELSTFVGSKKLKKTGGAMEIDRLRQEKDKDMLQRLFKEKQKQQQQHSGGTTAVLNDDDDDGDGDGGNNSEPRDTSDSNGKDDTEEAVEVESNGDGVAESENGGVGQDPILN